MQNAGEEGEEKSGYFFKWTWGDCVPGKYWSFACAANIDSIATLKWIIIKTFNSVSLAGLQWDGLHVCKVVFLHPEKDWDVLFEATGLLKVGLILFVLYINGYILRGKQPKWTPCRCPGCWTCPSAEGAGFVLSCSRASQVQSVQMRLTPHSVPAVLFEDVGVWFTAWFSCDNRIKRWSLIACTMRKEVELFRAVQLT